MKKIATRLYILVMFVQSSFAQTKNYNCVILDSIITAIQIKEEQNKFLLPLFKKGVIKTDGDAIYIITKDKIAVRKIDSVISRINVKERNIFLDDALFSLDTFNIIVDTFNFFDNSCNLCRINGKRCMIVNDYDLINNTKKSSNVIVVEMIAYSSRGALSIALRNTKSNFAIIFGIRRHSILYPSISIIDKCLYDPEHGLFLE